MYISFTKIDDLAKDFFLYLPNKFDKLVCFPLVGFWIVSDTFVAHIWCSPVNVPIKLMELHNAKNGPLFANN